MDYYEELGISRTASAEQVRHAYRQLARLMHPDQQLDESLRRLAETQMKRLNMVLAVLCDEERRRAYDLSLNEPALDESAKTSRLDQAWAWIERVPRSTSVWAAAAALGIIAIGVFFRSPGGEAVPAGRRAELPVRPANEVKAKPALVQLPTSQRAPRRIAIPATPEVGAAELPPSPEIETGAGNPPPMPLAETAGAAPGAASGMMAAGFGGKCLFACGGAAQGRAICTGIYRTADSGEGRTGAGTVPGAIPGDGPRDLARGDVSFRRTGRSAGLDLAVERSRRGLRKDNIKADH
jgi:hypothetical protein